MNKAEIEEKAKRKAGRRKCNNCIFFINDVCIRPELLGYSPRKLLQRAYKKVKGREQAPNYARKHRHIKLCRECKDFKFEDTFGLGYCNVLKKPKLCDQPCERKVKLWQRQLN